MCRVFHPSRRSSPLRTDTTDPGIPHGAAGRLRLGNQMKTRDTGPAAWAVRAGLECVVTRGSAAPWLGKAGVLR